MSEMESGPCRRALRAGGIMTCSEVANPDATLEPDTFTATLEAFHRFPDAGSPLAELP